MYSKEQYKRIVWIKLQSNPCEHRNNQDLSYDTFSRHQAYLKPTSEINKSTKHNPIPLSWYISKYIKIPHLWDCRSPRLRLPLQRFEVSLLYEKNLYVQVSAANALTCDSFRTTSRSCTPFLPTALSYPKHSSGTTASNPKCFFILLSIFLVSHLNSCAAVFATF